jgi:hypothetical protein
MVYVPAELSCAFLAESLSCAQNFVVEVAEFLFWAQTKQVL